MSYLSIAKTVCKKPVINPNKLDINSLPKGWIIIRKNGTIEDTLTREERAAEEREKEDKRVSEIMCNMRKRHEQYKRADMEMEGYSHEEIEYAIEHMYDSENESEMDYNSDQTESDYDSEN